MLENSDRTFVMLVISDRIVGSWIGLLWLGSGFYDLLIADCMFVRLLSLDRMLLIRDWILYDFCGFGQGCWIWDRMLMFQTRFV